MKITISFSDDIAHIQTFEITTFELDNTNIFEDLFRLSEDKVFVGFESVSGAKYENEHPTIMVTSKTDDLLTWFYGIIINPIYRDDVTEFNFFAFQDFEEAFNYCLELKEGL
jgi:hypothetical protein